MLPPFIIEQLREREERAREQARGHQEQPRLDLPTPGRVAKTPEVPSEDERGPVEIQIW